MPRVLTLTDQEYKVILAVRETAAHTASVSPDIMRELDTINYELEHVYNTNWEEVLDSVRRRVYGLLR